MEDVGDVIFRAGKEQGNFRPTGVGFGGDINKHEFDGKRDEG